MVSFVSACAGVSGDKALLRRSRRPGHYVNLGTARAVPKPPPKPALTCSSPATRTAASSSRGISSCPCSNPSPPACTSCATCGSTPAGVPATGARPSASAHRRRSPAFGWSGLPAITHTHQARRFFARSRDELPCGPSTRVLLRNRLTVVAVRIIPRVPPSVERTAKPPEAPAQ